MTLLEIIERLEHLSYCIENEYLHLKCTVLGVKDIGALKESASLLRKIAAGEYAPVVHGRWIAQQYIDEPVICSKCKCCPGELQVTDGFVDEEYPYCPHCGARMDGDPHA